jgi:phospholipid/cholesterol/gamma-HCH transport system permease protein
MHTFLDPIPAHISWFDILCGFAKSFIFGLLIVTICSFRGLITRGGAAGVGKATTNSVVACYSAILLANFLLTIGLNELYWFLYKHSQG